MTSSTAFFSSQLAQLHSPPSCLYILTFNFFSEIDTSFYVLTVDLWNSEGTREVNLVRHSATSPSISTATSSSYPPPPQNPAPSYGTYSQPQSAYPNSATSYGTSASAYSSPASGYPMSANYSPGGAYGHPAYSNAPPGYPTYSHPALGPPSHAGAPAGYYSSPTHQTPQGYQPYPLDRQSLQSPSTPMGQQVQPAPGGMFTRNLIGSLSASAFRLTDPDNKIGVWFILQDLSVRTEGSFRYDQYS